MDSLASMNVVDITILIIFLLSILIGLGRGFVSELLSLIVIIAAFVVAIVFTNSLANYFTSAAVMHNVMSETATTAASSGSATTQPASYMIYAVSFAILFAATVIVGGVIKILLNMLVSARVLGIGNRILGAIFGFIRGYLFVLVLIFLVQLSPASSSQKWQESKYVPFFQPQVVWLANIVSPTLNTLKSTFVVKTETEEETSDKPREIKMMEPATTTTVPVSEPKPTTPAQ
jgi:membrane protein required for colicin V production